jgi:hypothetical protein
MQQAHDCAVSRRFSITFYASKGFFHWQSDEFLQLTRRPQQEHQFGFPNIVKDRFLHLVFLRSVRRLLVTASVVPSSSILVTLMKEALSSSETLVLTRAKRRNITEDTIVHSHRRENLKSYTVIDLFRIWKNISLLSGLG